MSWHPVLTGAEAERAADIAEDEFVRLYPLVPYQVQLLIDAVTLGPSDLAQELGVLGTPDQGRVIDQHRERNPRWPAEIGHTPARRESARRGECPARGWAPARWPAAGPAPARRPSE